MRRRHPLLWTLFILAVIFVGVGMLRGWFYVSKTNEADNKVNLHLTVDTQKVKEDSSKVTNAAEELGDKMVDKAKHLGDKGQSEQPPTVAPAPVDQSAISVHVEQAKKPAPLEPPTTPIP